VLPAGGNDVRGAHPEQVCAVAMRISMMPALLRRI
jgi:hypothetical protein